MIISHDITPFRRFGLIIDETLWIDGMPYFTAEAIADALELKDRDDAVHKIVRRNPYIKKFSKSITVLVEELVIDEKQRKCRPASLAGQCPLNNPEIANMIRLWGGEQMRKKAPCYKTRTRKIKMTIFNPFGLQLIIMESRTKKAREFKIAAAQVVWAFITGKLFELDAEQLMAEQILEIQDKTEKKNKTKMLDLYCEKSGYSKATAYRHLKKVKNGESPQDKKYRNAKKPIISGDLELKIRSMWLEDKKQGYKKIYKRLGSPKSPEITAVRDFLRKLKKDEMMGKLASKECNVEGNKNKKNKK